MRTGIGYDLHILGEGETLVLGGVKIDFRKGLVGHSDADVPVHALCDALLGAAALGDIGKHFPDTDKEYRNISSITLLEEVNRKLKDEKYEVNNIDITIVCEEPNLSSYIDKMRGNMSAALIIPKNDISIKVTTNEGVGPEGRGEAISATAVVTIIPTAGYENV